MLIVSLAIGFVPIGIDESIGIEESIGIDEPVAGIDVGMASVVVAGAAVAAGDLVFVLPQAATTKTATSVNAPNRVRDRMVK